MTGTFNADGTLVADAATKPSAGAFEATLAVLVVTCPCALSLATPAAFAAATAALARRGVLVAKTDALETIARADRVLWDKTGTLTRGLVRVEDIVPSGSLTESQSLEAAAALERRSDQPSAHAGGGFDDGPGFEDLNEPILRSWVDEEKRFDSAKFGELGVPVAYPLFLLKALPNNAFYYISLFYNIQGENDI